MKNIIKTLLLVFLLPVMLKGQDPHWSMIQWNPVYLNPAFSGFAKKANRLTGIYRDQWRAVPVSYSTTHFSYDRRVIFNEEKGIRFGIGAQFHYDKAGDGALSSYRPGVSAAFGKYFHNNKQLIHIGMNGAYVVKQLDFNKLTFDSQFDGIAYDPTKSPEEQFSGNSSGYFDLGAGLNFHTDLKTKGNLDAGISAFNLTKPSFTFLTTSSSDVSPRLMAYTKADVKLGNTAWEINPGFFYQHQQKAREILIQTLFSVNLGDNTGEGYDYKLTFGPGYRWDDAVIGYIGVGWKDLRVAFAFDGNISDFNTGTSGRGAYELSVNYEFEKKKKDKIITIDSVVVEPEPEVAEEEPQDTAEITPVQVITEVPVSTPDPVAELLKQVEQFTSELNNLLPVQLFFDNDQPDPRSLSDTTTISYISLANTYIAQRPVYMQQYGEEAGTFFDTKVQGGLNTFNEALPKILLVLQQGKKVTVSLKGYTSPLATKKYNEALSERRIASVENYLFNWNNGVLKPYLDKGNMILKHMPFGESTANTGVSDNVYDPKNSIYNPGAAYERRVEIEDIAVE